MKGNEASKARHDETFYRIEVYDRDTAQLIGTVTLPNPTFTECVTYARAFEKRNPDRYCKIVKEGDGAEV